MPSIFRHLTYCKMGSIPVRVTKKEAIRKDGFFFGDWYVGANLSGSTARFLRRVNNKQKSSTKVEDFCLVPVAGLEPTRCRHQRILSYSSHSEPNGLNRNKTVFSVTFQNIKNPKKPYKISIFDAKHQKYKQFVPSSIIGNQIPNLRRWRDVGGM